MFGLFGKGKKPAGSSRTEPHYEMSDSPVVGYVLLDSVINPDQVIEALNRNLAPDDVLKWDERENEDDTVSFTLNGLWCAVEIMENPIPDREAQNLLHPLFGAGAEEAIENYQAFLLVAGMPLLSQGRDGEPLNHFDVVAHHVTAVRAILQLDEAVGYYSGEVATTYSKESFLAITDSDSPLLAGFMAPVWLSPREDGRWDAYSMGLMNWGIPEIQVIGSSREPNELFSFLMDFVEYQLKGNRVTAGETIGYSEDEKIKTSWQPFLNDEELTALQLEIK